MKTLQQRTQEALAAGFTAAQLAAAAKVTPPAVSQWLSGATKSLKGATAARLAVLTGWSATWWASGEGVREVPGSATAPAGGRPVLTQEPAPAPLDRALPDALEVLGSALALPLDPAVRADVADALHKLALRNGSARDQQAVLRLLTELPAKQLSTG